MPAPEKQTPKGWAAVPGTKEKAPIIEIVVMVLVLGTVFGVALGVLLGTILMVFG